MLSRTGLRHVASVLSALAVLEGCSGDDGGSGPDDPLASTWFAYFRLTQGDEAHLYLREEWKYALIPDVPGDEKTLSSEHRMTIEELFSNGVEDYQADSMSTSGRDMGECDATAAHPIVHIVLIEPDPLVGKLGFGCWSPDEDLSEDTRMMLQRMEGLLHALTGDGDGDGDGDDDAGM